LWGALPTPRGTREGASGSVRDATRRLGRRAAWPEFRAALIARIEAWETAPARDEPWSYYRLWLAALEDVLPGLSIPPAPRPGQAPNGQLH